MDEEIKTEVAALIDKFNERAGTDEKMQRELEGLERKIQVDFGEDGMGHFILKDKRCSDLLEGGTDEADIILTIDKATFKGLLSGEISIWKAYAKNKFKLKASLQDKLMMKKFF